MTSPRQPRGVARRVPVAALGAAAVAAVAVAIAGCGAQAEPGYLGEPLLALEGRLADSPVAPAQPLEAAILWQPGAPPSTAGQVLGARAPIEPGSPSTFAVRLFQPPPPEARRALAPGEPTFARATAAAVPFGITAPQAGALGDAAAPASAAYGIDPEHWLVWLAEDAPAGSLTAWWLGAPLAAGYHVVRVTPVDPACLSAAALDACAGDVAATGAPDVGSAAPGSARAFCLAPYRLSPAPGGDPLVLRLGATGLPAAPAGCPP